MIVALVALIAFQPGGTRVDLSDGATLYIPSGWKRSGDLIDVVMHLHGAPSVVEPTFEAAGWNAVLIEFNRSGLSSAYSRPFSDPALLPRLIDAALKAVGEARHVEKPKVGRLVVSSFSAGFGGVREILKVPEHFDRVGAIVLADSLYCGYAGNKAERRVDPDLMAGFRRFAKEAAEGRKSLLVTHSAQVPEGYASTTETADDLGRAVGAAPEAEVRELAPGLRLRRRFASGKLLILGFEGAGPADHMAHLRGLGTLWPLLPGGPGGAAPPPCGTP